MTGPQFQHVLDCEALGLAQSQADRHARARAKADATFARWCRAYMVAITAAAVVIAYWPVAA